MRRPMLALLATGLASTAWCQAEALEACRAIADPVDRVACYDAAVDAAAGEPAPPPNAESTFGRSDESIRELHGIDEVSEITSPVAEIRRSPAAYLIVTLANGQVWEQVRAAKLSLRPGDDVTVRAGFGGSYYLSKTAGSRSVKVRRVD